MRAVTNDSAIMRLMFLPGMALKGDTLLLAEVTLQNYSGYIGFEYKNDDENHHPLPALIKAIEFMRYLFRQTAKF